MSEKIAPGGIGWENWRQSENVDEGPAPEWDPVTGEVKHRGAPGDLAGKEELPNYFGTDLARQAGADDIDRMIMDRSAGMAGKRGMAAEIEFNNVPTGVDTEAIGEGFDDFNVTKTKQFEGAF